MIARLWQAFCLWRAERHGDLAWSPCCEGRATCGMFDVLHPSECGLRDRDCAQHILMRDRWYARHDRARAA
jgi:hypothetical protein